PTGGVSTDPNAQAAEREEYPMVIMECRGVDSPAATPEQRLSPSTCWTETADERFQDSPGILFPPWRLDRMATAAGRVPILNAPPDPSCKTGSPAQAYIPSLAADGTTYFGGPNSRCGIAPDMVTVEDPAAPPSNTTYAITAADGTGRATFIVTTQLLN